MQIPDDVLKSSESRRYLVLIAKKILYSLQLPKGSDAFEDILQEAFLRILRKPEPAPPISNWIGYITRVMVRVAFEKRREEWKDIKPRIEGWMASMEPRVDIRLEVEDQRLKLPAAMRTHFWTILNEERLRLSDDSRFERFVHLRLSGCSGSKAWLEVKQDFGEGEPDKRATFFRWFRKLRTATRERWLSLGYVEALDEV